MVLTPNRNHPPAKLTDTGAPASGDDLSIPASLRRNPDGKVASNCAATNGDDAKLPVVAGSPSDTPLRIFEDAKRRLAAAKTVDEAKSIRDIAMGLVEYARHASDRQLEWDAAAIRMEAERVIGQLMQKQKEGIGLNKGGRPKTRVCETPVSDQLPTLAEAGIDKNLAKKARAAAAMSHEEFEAHKRAEGEAVRTRTRSRTKSPTVKARAPTQRRERKRCIDLDKWLSQISAICRYDDEMELPADFNAAKVDAAIVTVTGAIGELNKLIRRLEEARPQK